MEYLLHVKKRAIYTLIVGFLLAGCVPLIGAYSPTAYKNATSLKAETLAIMDKADEQYALNKTKVESVTVELSKAHEYVKGLPGDSISAQQWEILINPDGDLIGKFFKRWKERGTLSKVLIDQYKPVISDSFDEIICLEANKKEASECSKDEGEQ